MGIGSTGFRVACRSAIWRAPVLTRSERAVFAGTQIGQPPHALGVTGDAEDREQRFLRSQHAGLEHLERDRAGRAPAIRSSSAAVRRWPTRDSPGCSAAGRRTLRASAQAHNRAPVMVTRCSTTAEPNISRKKYSSGFSSRQRVCASSSSSGAGADGDEHRAMGAGCVERVPQPRAGEAHAVDDDRVVVDAQRARSLARRPTAGRAARTSRAPSRPVRCARSSSTQPARIPEQPRVLGGLHVDSRSGVDDLDHRVDLVLASTGLNWQPSTKKSKKSGMRLEPAMLDAFSRALRARRRLARESSAIVAPSIAALPTWTILSSARFGISPMRFDAARLQVPAEAAGEIEHVDVVELDAVLAEHDLQPGDVGALGLRQLVDVALEKVEAALGIERDRARRRPRIGPSRSSGRCAAARSSDRRGPIRRCPPARRRR